MTLYAKSRLANPDGFGDCLVGATALSYRATTSLA